MKKHIKWGILASVIFLILIIIICFIWLWSKSQDKLVENKEENKLEHFENGWETSIVKEILEDEIPVPVGYTYIEGNKQNGVVIQDNVTKDEYMWIPYVDVFEEATDSIENIKEKYQGRLYENTKDSTIDEIKKYNGFYVMIDNRDKDVQYEEYKENFIQKFSDVLSEEQLNAVREELDKMSYEQYKEYYEDKTGETLELLNINDISDEKYNILNILNSNDYNKNKNINTNTLTNEQLACIKAYQSKNGININLSSSLKTFTLLKENNIELSSNDTTENKVISEEKELSNGNKASIPKGFVFEGYITDENGEKISIKIKNGDNLSYIWVPVSDMNTFNTASELIDQMREEASGSTVSKSQNDTSKSSEEYKKMIESIEKYGGYYVSEAELSINNDGYISNIFKAMGESGRDSEGNLLYGIQNGEYFRNGGIKTDEKFSKCNIKDFETANNVATSLYSTSETVVSHIMYANEYDYLLNWIMETNGNVVKNQILTDSSDIGKYVVRKDEDGNDVNSGLWNETLLNGIFGLGGNLWELTQEDSNNTVALRGGSFVSRGNENPISYKRWVSKDNWTYEAAGSNIVQAGSIGIRISLYIKTEYEENEELQSAKEKAKEEFDKVYEEIKTEYEETTALKSIKEYIYQKIDEQTSEVLLDKLVNYGKITLEDNYCEALDMLKEHTENEEVQEMINTIKNTNFVGEDGTLVNYVDMAETAISNSSDVPIVDDQQQGENQVATDHMLFIADSWGYGAEQLLRNTFEDLILKAAIGSGSYQWIREEPSGLDLDNIGGDARWETISNVEGVKSIYIALGINGPGDSKDSHKELIDKLRKAYSDVPIYVQKTFNVVSRHTDQNNAINELNDIVEEYCSQCENVYFIDTTEDMMENGALKDSLAGSDGIHLTEEGKQQWINNIKQALSNIK